MHDRSAADYSSPYSPEAPCRRPASWPPCLIAYRSPRGIIEHDVKKGKGSKVIVLRVGKLENMHILTSKDIVFTAIGG